MRRYIGLAIAALSLVFVPASLLFATDTSSAQALPTVTPAHASPPAPTTSPGSDTTKDTAVTGIVWAWQQYLNGAGGDNITVPDPERYRLVLLPDNLFTFQAGCITGNGWVSDQDGVLTLNRGPMTLANCGPDALHTEYLTLLSEKLIATRHGETLVLSLGEDGGDMLFNRLPILTGAVYELENQSLPEGSRLEIAIMDQTTSPPTQVGGQVVEGVTNFPVAFEAAYDLASIAPDGVYALLAAMKDADDNVLHVSPRPYPVLTHGNPTHNVDVLVEPSGPALVLPTPAPQAARGRVIAPSGLNLRTGPGLAYPVIFSDPFDAAGELAGRDESGQW